MKKIALFVILSTLLAACNLLNIKMITASGNRITQKHNVQNFTNLEIQGAIDVTLEQGNIYKVEVETDDNIMPYVEVKKEGHKLLLRIKHNVSIKNGDGVKVTIQMPGLEKIDLSGSGELKTLNQIKVNNQISLDMAGSSHVELNLKAPEVKIEIEGSGTATLVGETRNFSIDMAGSAELTAVDFMAENTDVSISGSGSATVFASQRLDASVAGSGQIKYKGAPPAVKKNTSGSGSIDPIP